MPHFIKGLGNVEKCSGTVLLGFAGFMDSLDDTVGLFYCGMSLPEAKLVSGYESVGGHHWEDRI
jgi:hypothetical protein